jgi:hypothetical protein
MMKFIGLVALNLALCRGITDRGPTIPFVSFLFASTNLLGIQALLLGRPLGAFHYAFLVIGIFSSIIFTLVSASWTPQWQAAASAFGVLIPLAVSLYVAGQMQSLDETLHRRPRVIVAWIYGAVIGFGVFALGATVAAWITPNAPTPHTARWYAHFVGLVGCPVWGGALVARPVRMKQGPERIAIRRAISRRL